MEAAQNIMNMAGLYTPTARFVGVAGAVAAGLYYFKPGMFFLGNMPRAWSVLQAGPGATMVPAWLAAVGSGVVASTVI